MNISVSSVVAPGVILCIKHPNENMERKNNNIRLTYEANSKRNVVFKIIVPVLCHCLSTTFQSTKI